MQVTRCSFYCKLLSILLLSFIGFGCKYKRNKLHADVSLASIRAGENLAKIYCQSCHQLPDPQLLDANTWEHGVLPAMGPRLGIYYYGFERYPYQKNESNIGANFYPEKPLLSYPQWQNIIDYYTATSPDTLINTQTEKIAISNIKAFTVVEPKATYTNPATAFLGINHQQLLAGDATSQQLFLYDQALALIARQKTQAPIVAVATEKTTLLACNIGFMNPNNGSYGKLQQFAVSTSRITPLSPPIIDSLQRPVDIAVADLYNNGSDDYVICEFGFLTGALSWYQSLGNQKFAKHVLLNQPGAIKAYTTDYNHDGLIDIWALLSQGNEGIYLFTNKGGGNFEQKQVLQFPASYGSSYFEMVDFDRDGDDDIVYTCGDNADFSRVLKPYHGVYIFVNQGNNIFKQEYFFAINGCYKAIARDFDGDGDTDIAAIAFFADYANRPEEGFVYLENKGNYRFNAISPKETQRGRWLTMTSGDLNGDSKPDIVLGNFSVAPTFVPSRTDFGIGPPFLVLMSAPIR